MRCSMECQTPDITPVILCGGSVERLWPLSRKSYRQQCLDLIGKGSLFQQTATRLKDAHAPLVITGGGPISGAGCQGGGGLAERE